VKAAFWDALLFLIGLAVGFGMLVAAWAMELWHQITTSGKPTTKLNGTAGDLLKQWREKKFSDRATRSDGGR
jgi:hypothetical protein